MQKVRLLSIGSTCKTWLSPLTKNMFLSFTFLASITLPVTTLAKNQTDLHKSTETVQSDYLRSDASVNPSDVQIIFVDLQPELTRNSRTVKPFVLGANAAVLAHVASITGIPVTFSTVPLQGKFSDPIPELQEYVSGKNTIRRVKAGTFMEPALISTLARHHRRVLVVSGYATEVAVLQTALAALKAGYQVYVPVDAIGSPSGRTEAAALHQMEYAGVVTGSVMALAAQLAPDFSRKPGSEVLKSFSDLRPAE